MAHPVSLVHRVSASNTQTFATDPIKLRVGGHGEAQLFWVHRHVLDSRAEFTDYFSSALKREWQREKDPVINLPDAPPEIFEAYLEYIYRGKVSVKKDKVYGCSDYNFLGLLYGFGELIVDRDFQNRVIDALVMGGRDSVVLPNGEKGTIRPVSAVGAIYASTPADSPARKLMVDYHLASGSPHWIDEFTLLHASAEDSLEFLKELSKAFMQRKPRDFKELSEGIPQSYYHKVVSLQQRHGRE
jgi:hypothetical protein